MCIQETHPCTALLPCEHGVSRFLQLFDLLRAFRGEWCVLGDFNADPEEVHSRVLEARLRGQVLHPGEATSDTGAILDFGLV